MGELERHYPPLSSGSSRVLETIGLFGRHYTQLIGALLSEYSLVDVCVWQDYYLFRLLGEWAVFLKIINALERSLIQGFLDEMWNAVKSVQSIRQNMCGWTSHCLVFQTHFHIFVIPLIKHYQSRRMAKHSQPTEKYMLSPECLTWWKMHETTTLIPNVLILCPQRKDKFIECIFNRVKRNSLNCKKEADICPGSQSYQWFNFYWTKKCHATWACQQVHSLWIAVTKKLATILSCRIPLSPSLCLLGDFTQVL